MKKYLQFSKDVKEALKNKQPVIALESTIISHGMPYPQNMEVANRLEAIASKMGVTPATICLMDGKVKIGLEKADLKILATANDIAKVSRRDIGRILVQKRVGATTVAATMIAANRAGIKVFATGGIGGVHRNAEDTFDISNDLIELSRIPVIVVSAGAKAILDLSKTLEYLETIGVPVYGYQTDKFPAFYSSQSNQVVDKIDTPRQIADIYKTNMELGLNNGMLIANPIPEQFEIPFAEMEEYIDLALKKAGKNNITGRELTPFLLLEIVKITKGRSLQANIKLVENNVRLACEIAKEL